jgi:hypothetical protein
VEVAAPPGRVWDALVRWLERPSSAVAERGAAVLGCEPRTATGRAGEEGSTIVGFGVERSVAPAELLLAGRHRFSRYSLQFLIDDLGAGRSRLRAVTRAEFPGVAGRAYRALVIGTRMHVLVVRRVLRGVSRRVESTPSPSSS